MRLVSEDDVLALLTNHHFDNDKGNFDLLIHNLCKEVRRIPTAYDVDAVVEQLEREKQTSTSAKNEAIIGMCGASANHYGGAECAYQRAIEIVKRSRKEREIGMTLENFLENYGGNGCISIDGYCEEKEYDHIYDAEWWNELKDKEIASWNIIGGGIYPLELFIEIQE